MFVLNQSNSIANHFLTELRDVKIQQDSMRFRKNMERLGEILAYELSKSFDYIDQQINSPLGIATVGLMKDQPVLIPIMRAGIPFYQGVLNYFDIAKSGFIGAYRYHEKQDGDFDINLDYVATPSLEGRRVILIDPMLATGKSILKSIDILRQYGEPSHIDIMAVIASPEGVDQIKNSLSSSFQLWIGAVDERLNDNAYIVPGLGDAGDLAFGEKL